jgi:formate-dependent nitrite reductase membrane component NrfD
MQEDLITSGRMNPMIDPHLEVWDWQIPSYLFLGGVAAGILFFAGLSWLRNKEFPTAIKVAPLFVPFILIMGLFFLFLDLKHKLFFWQLYTIIRPGSPMNWGAWTLLVITPLSIIWAALHIREIRPEWNWNYRWLILFEEWMNINKSYLAWSLVILSVILGVYTGILFSDFNARPLSILGPLFLVSGLSSGAAIIVLLSKSEKERHYFSRIDLGLIAVELFLIIHLFMGFFSSNQAQIEAANLFLGGAYTAQFWVFVVGLGLVLPAVLEIMEMRKKVIPFQAAAILVLMGGLFLRFILSYAGQISHWVIK